MGRPEPPPALREGADRVAARLREAGFQAYLAGGCVRDALLGDASKDFDIATDARPDEVAGLFRRTIMVGAAFGVVKVVLGRGRDYEVATFRTEGAYSDGRRPDDVAYTRDPEEDVKRRDFTINALLMDPRDDRVVDYVGGRADLEAGLIRAVGEPQERFREDRLRMLRAVRFAARLGFGVEAETRAAIEAEAGRLSEVSVERIAAELDGIFASPRPGYGFGLLEDTGLLPAALPFEPRAPDRVRRAMARLPEATAGLELEQRLSVAWALALEGIAPAEAEGHLRALRASRERIRAVKGLLAAQERLSSMEPEGAAESVALVADAAAPRNLAFQLALLGPDAEAVQRAEAIRADLRARPLPPRPVLTGADLKAAGFRPGPHFKALLDAVDRAVLARRVQTKDEALELARGHGASS